VSGSGTEPESSGEPAEDRRTDSVRRRVERQRQRRRVFGDVLDGSTLDDRPDPGAAGEAGTSDRWLRDNVPPHHGS
jgi:hypothetical protein